MYEQTNPRYRTFCQEIYTVGDEEQWFFETEDREKFFDMEESLEYEEKEEEESDSKIDLLNYSYNLSAKSPTRTFRYLFHNLKKGIFIRIRKGRLEKFLPFSKQGYTNAWGKKIVSASKYKKIESVLREAQSSTKFSYNASKVNMDQSLWVTNGHLVRFEYPLKEGDTNVANILHMIKTLCQRKKVPDVEFFINRRDFPTLRKDGAHPYDEYVDCSFMKHYFGDFRQYSPIFSMTTREEYLDVAIPTFEDWARVMYQGEKRVSFSSIVYKNRAERTYEKIPSVPWKDKIDKVIFRGASTGKGVTLQTNLRLKAVNLTHDDPDFDVGITEWNTRPRVVTTGGKPVLDAINLSSIPFPLVEKLTPVEQSAYKYILNIDGHCRAFRLGYELGYNSVILLVDSPYKLWFTHLLKPFEHYVPVKRDFSDLKEKLIWCRSNNLRCEEISSNALSFQQRYLSEEGILCSLQSSLTKISEANPYLKNILSLKEVTYQQETRLLNKKIQKIPFPETEEVFKIAKSRTTMIRRCDDNIVKFILDKNKKYELCHEAFIGGLVLKDIPENILHHLSEFRGLHENGETSWKYINGVTAAHYISSNEISVHSIVDIFLQVCGILQYLQDHYSFVHNDLLPWNIMLEQCDPDEEFLYENSRGDGNVERGDFAYVS